MICAVHQPQYLPWPGYFSKLDAADVFVIYDDTQYKHGEWQNRNRIKSPNTEDGWQWLTVPVHHSEGELIREIRIDNRHDWPRKHLNAMAASYSRAPYYKDLADDVESLLSRPWERLADLNVATVRLLGSWLGVEKEMAFSSELDYEGRATDALVSMCRCLDADTYLSGSGGRDYLEPEKFEEAGVRLILHEYVPPEYPQPFGAFVPGLSAADLVFNCGPASLTTLRSGRSIVTALSRPNGGDE